MLTLLAAGDSNATVARRLGVSRRTVEKHLQNAYRKLEVAGRAEAMAVLFGSAAGSAS